MSIVHNVKDKLPREGQIVYADNGKYSSDRAIFEDGNFIGGGDFPVRRYKMSFVSKWFCLEEYQKHMEKIGNGRCYSIGFSDAEKMTYEEIK